jgi:uncharacterized protein YbcI
MSLIQREATPIPSDSRESPMRQGDNPLLTISNAIVRLYKDSLGRGPTKARTHFAGPDMLVVTLEHTLTVAERGLSQRGEYERLSDNRLFIQYALEEAARKVVEQALGRRTVAFVTGIDPRRDVALKFFTLAPAANGDGAGAPARHPQ